MLLSVNIITHSAPIKNEALLLCTFRRHFNRVYRWQQVCFGRKLSGKIFHHFGSNKHVQYMYSLSFHDI